MKINEEEQKSCKIHEERRIEYGKKLPRKRIRCVIVFTIKEPEIEEVTGEIVQNIKIINLNQIKNNLEKDLPEKLDELANQSNMVLYKPIIKR